MIEMAVHYYRLLIRYTAYVAPFVLLLIRMGWGWEMVESGRGHLTHLSDTVAFFQSLNIPAPKANAIISGTVELVGGIFLMLGFASRLITIPLAFNFLVAILTASSDNVKHIFTQDFSKIVDDTAFPFMVASLVIFVFGPGFLSIDGLLKATALQKYLDDKDNRRGFEPSMK